MIKPGRPKLPAEKKHVKTVLVRLTEAEHTRLTKFAEREGVGLAPFVRKLVLRELRRSS